MAGLLAAGMLPLSAAGACPALLDLVGDAVLGHLLQRIRQLDLAALARLGVPRRVIGVAACVENMPDGNAFRPAWMKFIRQFPNQVAQNLFRMVHRFHRLFLEIEIDLLLRRKIHIAEYCNDNT